MGDLFIATLFFKYSFKKHFSSTSHIYLCKVEEDEECGRREGCFTERSSNCRENRTVVQGSTGSCTGTYSAVQVHNLLYRYTFYCTGIWLTY